MLSFINHNRPLLINSYIKKQQFLKLSKNSIDPEIGSAIFSIIDNKPAWKATHNTNFIIVKKEEKQEKEKEKK
jgi:hypothetical protein